MDTKNLGVFAELVPKKTNGQIAELGVFADLVQKPKEDGGSLETIKNYGKAIDSALGLGISGIEAGLGNFVQAPAANTLSFVKAIPAVVDRGMTNLINAVSPGEAVLYEPAQKEAQAAAAFAAESRQENVDSKYNVVAKAGKWVQDNARNNIKEIEANDAATNPELIRQQKEMGEAEGFTGNLVAAAKNPMALGHTLVKSVPDMALGLGAGRLAASRVLATEAAVGEAAAARVAAAGGDAIAQKTAAEAAINVVREKATAAASTAGMLSEGASSANSSRETSHAQVVSMPFDKLANSPRFNELVKETGSQEKAREILANEVADQTAAFSGGLTVAGTLVTNKLFGGDATAKALAGVEKASIKNVIKDIGQEGVEEVTQGVPQGFTDHQAMQIADPNKKFDLGGEIAQNALGGILMGGGGHGGAYAYQKAGDLKSIIDAKRATGEEAPNSQSDVTNTRIEKPSEAEAALMKPKNISALDRVGEIDNDLVVAQQRFSSLTPENGYGPTFDDERQELQESIQQLQQERDQITQAWPKSIDGAETKFSTEAGVHLGAKYALMEAGDIQTSHDENLRANPAYPPELQPRERDRAASSAQISGIVSKMDPARLGLSADAATGAPIVGADGLVESGNARTIALKRVFRANGQKAEDYKNFLTQNAAQFGIDPLAVGSMTQPVLVRVRTTPVNRAEFARQANASTVARMSPVEQARSDAARLDVLDDLNPDENGDFTTSRDFVRRFMAKVPQTEVGEMMDSDGRLSPAGYARMRNAVLAKAYGDSPVILRMTDSLDDNLRNVSKALMQVAPQIAKVRSGINEGYLHDADITPDLMGAVEELSRIKEQGGTVKDYLSQSGMFGDKLTDEGAEMLRFLDENIRRPRKMAEFILRYTQALEAMGNPGQASMFEDNFKPTKQDLLTAARRDQDATQEPASGEGENKESTVPSGPTDSQRVDARSNEEGDQGNVEDTGRQTEQLEAARLAKAQEDMADALDDLGAIARKVSGVKMMKEEDYPNLLPTLVKLFGAAFRIVGHDMKKASAHVREALRADPTLKKIANFIKRETMEKAAAKAFDNFENEVNDQVQGDMFAAPAKAAAQPDLFSGQSNKAPATAMINGQPYDMAKHNFKPQQPPEFLTPEMLDQANDFIAKYYKGKKEYPISNEERAKGEALLAPFIEKAMAVKVDYDQKIIDIANRTGALGQQLAPIKGAKRAVEKMKQDQLERAAETGEEGPMDPKDVKDLLRSTIVVSTYEHAQQIVNEINKEFKVLRVKNRTESTVKDSKVTPRQALGGYSDVLINVAMPNGTVAEIQINVPEMLSIKEHQGHKLYEAARDLPAGDKMKTEIYGAMTGIYDAAFAAAKSRQPLAQVKNASSEMGAALSNGNLLFSNLSPESSSLNTLPSGNSTNSLPSKDATNVQPGGNLVGKFMGSTSDQSITRSQEKEYNDLQNKSKGDLNENGTSSAGPLEGQGTGSAQGNDGRQNTKSVRDGQGRRDTQRDSDTVASGEDSAQSGQVAAPGENPATEQPRQSSKGSGNKRPSTVPASKYAPVKTGQNFYFGPTDLDYKGSWRKKAEQNVEAVELLHKLNEEKRQATSEEQAILAKFIGWGASEIANGIFDPKLSAKREANSNKAKALEAFDNRKADVLYGRDSGYYQAFQAVKSVNPSFAYGLPISKDAVQAVKTDTVAEKWGQLYDRLSAVLSKEEMAEASRSTQYAHYTGKEVVTGMWKAMQRMGFNGGSILEPGAGIGVFPGLMPASMAANSTYTGIEFDTATGGILKQLFPDERILVESFIDSKLPKNFYDVAIGNPPFNATPILMDPEYKKHGFALHDYFFAKTIDRVKPGGLVMFVTSRYTMDKMKDRARSYMAERADLVGAIRLPQTAFQKNAGTEVVTDVLFLRKKVEGEKFEHAQDWLKAEGVQTVDGPAIINEYFAKHPEMVLGTNALRGSMYSANEYTVLPLEGDIAEHFIKAVERMPENIFSAGRDTQAEAVKVREIDFNPKAKKEGNYYVSDAGVLMQRENGVGSMVELRTPKDIELVKDFVVLRDALKQAQYDQLNGGEWEKSLKALGKAYDAFVNKNGKINQYTTSMRKVKSIDEETGETIEDEVPQYRYPILSKISDDPDYTTVAALEDVDHDKGTITKSKFLSERVLDVPKVAEIKTPADALLATLNDTGKVNIPMIAERIGMSEEDTIASLGSLVYDAPNGGWQMADEYLSGNVKKKLAEAIEAAKSNPAYKRNIEALEAALPAPIPFSNIDVRIGANWIPGEVYEEFFHHFTGAKASVRYNEHTGNWIYKADKPTNFKARDFEVTNRWHAATIFEHALNGAPIRISKNIGTSAEPKMVLDGPSTEKANEILNKMHEEFSKNWIWSDGTRADTLSKMYNDKFNNIANRTFDGRHLTLPGSTSTISVFDHVKRGAWRIIQSGNTYLAHAVGSGKTWQMVIAAMEEKRLGLSNKPMMVVPNHMLQQFAREWMQLYPSAKLMVADEKNFAGDKRRRFVSRVAMSDLDGVIITHSAFKILDLDHKFKSEMIEDQLVHMRAALEEAGDDRRDPKVKQIESQIERMEQKLGALMSSTGKDNNVSFDELGVDRLYVDEAHEYRKLAFTTQRQVKGIDSNGSDMAFDLWLKSRWLERKRPGRSLVMASGTPITNTIAELYTVQRFMGADVLEERGLSQFDDWAAQFGREKTEIEADASGKYMPVTRFAKFANVPELIQMFREFADVLTSDHLANMLGDRRPKLKDGSRNIVIVDPTFAQRRYKKELKRRLEISRKWKPSRDEPNNPDPIIKIIGDGRLASIDERFMDPSLPNNPGSKLNKMIDDVIATYNETKNWEYKGKDGKVEPIRGAAQMVFTSIGFGAGVTESRGFNARAWMEKRLRDAGIKPGEIAFMSDYKKSTAKLALFKDVNAGKVRILVGSDKNMGTGVNAQQRLITLHHLDTPWYPAALEQREGRIIRQGNKNPIVRINAYSTKGSYDQVMWQLLATKQHFIGQALSGDSQAREIDDVSEESSFSMATAMTADDGRAVQLAGLKADTDKLNRLYIAHEEKRARMRSEYRAAEATIEMNKRLLPAAEKAAEKVQDLSGDKFKAKIDGKTYTNRSDFGKAMIQAFKDNSIMFNQLDAKIGEISGFPIKFLAEPGKQETTRQRIVLEAGGQQTVLMSDPAQAIDNPSGLAIKANNVLVGLARAPAEHRRIIETAKDSMNALEGRLNAPFEYAGMLANKVAEADALEKDIIDNPTEIDDTDGEGWPIAPQDRSRLSRNTGARIGTKEVKKVVDRITAKLKNLPKVHVFASPTDEGVPKGLRAYIEGQGALNDVEGAMHNGEIYMFSDHLASEERAEFVLAEHEAGHYGLRGAFGKDLDKVLQGIFNSNPSVRKAASKLQARGKLSDVVATEEVIVDIPNSELVKLKGWRRMALFVRDWLAANGFEKLAMKLDGFLAGNLSSQEKADLLVADVMRAARAWVKGHRDSGYATATRLSTRMEDDMTSQAEWLNNEAKAQGFDDIEQMLEKDYPAFVKLAAKWRQENPVDSFLSRVAPPIADKDGVIRVNGREYSARLADEPFDKAGDKKYAKRAIDTLPSPKELPFFPKKFFKFTKNTVLLNMADIVSTKSDEENLKGGTNAPKRFLAAFDGILPARGPIAVMRRDDGKYDVIDGNGTYSAFKGYGWSQIPVEIFNSVAEFEASENNAKPYRAFALTDKDQVALLKQFKPTHAKVVADHISADGFESVPANAKVVGVADADGIQALVVEINGKTERANGEVYHISMSSDEGVSTSGASRMIKENGYKKLADPVILDLSAGVNVDRPYSVSLAANVSRLSRPGTAAERAEEIIQRAAATPAPVDRIVKAVTKLSQLDKVTTGIYNGAAFILDRFTPETLKAGFVSDYGVPEAVIDRRAALSGHMNVQTRKAGKLIDKLSTLTREESRVAYEWMNNSNPDALKYFEDQLPEESVKVLAEVKDMIEALSKEAVALGQLSHDAYEQNKMEYLRRSYAKHTLNLDEKEKKSRARAISILGDQYKGRGLAESAPMKKMQNIAPDWWGRKLKEGKADVQLKGEKFVRLEKHAHSGEGTMPLEGIGDRSKGRLQEVVYYPAGEPIPRQYAEWEHAGTYEVRDTKGENVVLWRDFTKAEREQMGEIDEARFAIAKTLHGMIHDVEVGRYMEWLNKKYGLTHASQVPGDLIEAKELGLSSMNTVYKKGDWVQVPETKIAGTDTHKYGKLAGKYIPGPIWNDLRQINSGSFKPLGDVYASVLRAWKMSKTALSPAVHMNNVMANMVMADWHDVTAGHIAKSLRILMAASDRDGTGLIGTAQNVASRAGIADREAAKEIVNRYQDSGGNIGTWASAELQNEQVQPLLDALEAEMAKDAESIAAQVGVMNALQFVLAGRFSDAASAFVGSKPVKAIKTEGGSLIDLYQSEDEVFRLAAWLKAKEDGETDMQAGHKSRKSFLDYNINAPWMAGLRATALPFAAFSYRAIPMMAETMAKRPWKIMKLAMLGGMLNALGYMLSGGDEDDERRYLPEEKAGRVWGMVPKLIRMPWNDSHDQPVFLDVRRFIPVGDVFDLGQQHSAVPLPPAVMPGGPMALIGEVVLNKSMFTGQAITEGTDTNMEKVGKTIDYLYKAMAPNLPILPGTHSFDGIAKANSGGTDAFGRELSTGQAVLNSFGVKVGSYGQDTLRVNAAKKMQAELMEIDHSINKLKREYGRKGMTYDQFVEKVRAQQEKKKKLAEDFRGK